MVTFSRRHFFTKPFCTASLRKSSSICVNEVYKVNWVWRLNCKRVKFLFISCNFFILYFQLSLMSLTFTQSLWSLLIYFCIFILHNCYPWSLLVFVYLNYLKKNIIFFFCSKLTLHNFFLCITYPLCSSVFSCKTVLWIFDPFSLNLNIIIVLFKLKLIAIIPTFSYFINKL